MTSPKRMPNRTARRLLLAGAGLLRDPTEPMSLEACIESLGFVQIDSIHVLERAHHHILRTRLSTYRPELLDRLHEGQRRIFEHWTHDASYLPISTLPWWRHRFRRARTGGTSKWWRERVGLRPELIQRRVLRRLKRDGPLEASQLGPRTSGKGAWWDWTPEKAVVEHLWRTGKVAVHGRRSFRKVYDLAERVYAPLLDEPLPAEDDYVDWACRTALERLGAATSRELVDFAHAVTRAEADRWIRSRSAEGELVPVTIATASDQAPREAIAFHDWRERMDALPDPPRGARFLSPFDPAIRDRARTLRLFGFDYRFEAFVPAAKRRYGYYVLPILLSDALVARLDARLDRRGGCLQVLGFWWEGRAPARMRRCVAEGLDQFADALGAKSIERAGAAGDLIP